VNALKNATAKGREAIMITHKRLADLTAEFGLFYAAHKVYILRLVQIVLIDVSFGRIITAWMR
jgi:hypothetical protein